ncbi:PIN domain-containing protein [Deinococcus sp. 6YEL10]|uniref:PIN domain-containing protein n=1 Tax=Deinococcus sp. 6YEL10 TaxID=2745870 RepID=UPI001E3667F7|nr:PIN domain-containing protein [Deinococcus sp. 6YEL10]MCD0160471.1 PIN domain-containing protein [Deinococcus sp. 6YEL10]
MIPRHTALYDANVLYPSLLRNLLMHLAVSGLVAARWTDAIHDEWGRNLLLNRPDLGAPRVQRIRALMDQAVPDAQVTGYEALIESLSLPDPDDRHVLAAAIHAQADVIVTLNLKDFPREPLEPYGVQVMTPDTLLLALLEAEPLATRDALEGLRSSFRRPPVTWEELTDRLTQAGLIGSIAEIRNT